MKKLKPVPNYKRLFYITFCMAIFSAVVIVGSICNDLAKQSNGGKMPVLIDYELSSNRHFSYMDKNTVNYWYLTDIVYLGDYILSIGDILMISAFLSQIGLVIVSFYMAFTRKLYQEEVKNAKI